MNDKAETETGAKKRSASTSNNFVKDCMVSALMQLLEVKPMSEITVTDITDKAGVSRMSYYRNYSSKSEILTSHLDDIFNQYIELIQKWDYKGSCFDYEYLLQCFRYFSKHEKFLSCLLKSGMGDLMLSHMTRFILDSFHISEDDVFLYYKMQAFAGSIYSTYVAWTSRNKKESPCKMAQIVSAIYAGTGIV
jgi:AcrR family transcriptional regulator